MHHITIRTKWETVSFWYCGAGFLVCFFFFFWCARKILSCWKRSMKQTEMESVNLCKRNRNIANKHFQFDLFEIGFPVIFVSFDQHVFHPAAKWLSMVLYVQFLAGGIELQLTVSTQNFRQQILKWRRMIFAQMDMEIDMWMGWKSLASEMKCNFHAEKKRVEPNNFPIFTVALTLRIENLRPM